MSKYWRKTVTGDYSRMFRRWRTDIENAPKGVWFMGRITGTNRARAVRQEADKLVDTFGDEMSICQWITFTDYADIRSCVWRQM